MESGLALNLLIAAAFYVYIAWVGGSAPRWSLKASLPYAGWSAVIAIGAVGFICAWGAAHQLTPYQTLFDAQPPGVFDNSINAVRSLALLAVLLSVHSLVVVVSGWLRGAPNGG